MVVIANAERSRRSSGIAAPVPSASRVIISKLAATGCGVDHERLVGLGDECRASRAELGVVGASARAGEPQQRVAVREAHTGAAFGHRAQVELLTGLCAAPTEHAGVCGHSIEALAQLGQPRRDELRLRARQAARPPGPVRLHHFVRRHVLRVSPMRQVFRCSAGTAVYAWTTAATSSAGSATGTQLNRADARCSGRCRVGRPSTGAGSGGTSTPMFRQKWATAATVDTMAHSSTYGNSPNSATAASYTPAGHRAGVAGEAVRDVVGHRWHGATGAQPARGRHPDPRRQRGRHR